MIVRNMAIVASVAAIGLGACAKKAEESAPAADAVEAAPAEEPMVEAETMAADAAPIGSANITVTMVNGVPAFGSVSEGACAPGGGCVGGINTNAAGNVDLSGFPPGDITINVNLDSTVTGAGYSFPSDPYAAVAIVVIPPNSTTTPTPNFGQAYWPAEFDAPSVSGVTLSFVDKEDDQQAYEYAINLVVPGGGGLLTLDPRIQNSGSGNK